MAKKRDLPKQLKKGFRRKPYDIHGITRFFEKKKIPCWIGYSGYDVYTINCERKEKKFVRGKELINYVVKVTRRKR